MAQAYVSGLPGVIPRALGRPGRRDREEVFKDAERAIAAKRARRRKGPRNPYDVPGTPETRRLTLRILGERDD